MAKTKRKARKKLAPKVDVTVPVSIDIIGSKDDPCFGKLNDPRHPICMRCGDIEICAIAMSQMTAVKRLALEKKEDFKDIEETKIKPPDRLIQKKEIKGRIKEMIKLKAHEKEEVVRDVYGKYATDGWTKKTIGKIFDKVITLNKKHITFTKNKYKWSTQ